jgi:hypothetical protein
VGVLSISLFAAAPPVAVGADEPEERGAVAIEPLASDRLRDGRYPDLRAVPSLDLSMGTEVVGGRVRYVLRFSTEIWNAGPGPLELIGVSIGDSTFVYQRVFGENGGQEEFFAGRFAFHPVHNHWHFEEFALHELWRADDYERWLASGRAEGQAGWRANKTTGGGESLCIRDTKVATGYGGRLGELRYNGCDPDIQGISVGWGDEYPSDLPGQWIDLGLEPLPDGEYALRLVADPWNRIVESPDRDPAREGPEANEAVTTFTVRGSSIVGQPQPWKGSAGAE